MTRLFRIFLACLLLLLSVAGILLPVLPGWSLIILAGLLVASDVPFVARLFCRIETRFPRLRQYTAKSSRFLHLFGSRLPECGSEYGKSE
ncbi:MAG: hypothetical protein ABFD97_12115 [Syntrophobacter sp.]